MVRIVKVKVVSNLRVGEVHRRRRLDDQFLQSKSRSALVPQYNITPIPLRTIHGVIVFEDVVGRVCCTIREHATITAHHLHLELARLELTILPIAKALEVVRWFLGIELPALVATVAVVREVVGSVGGGTEGDTHGEGVDGRGVVARRMRRSEGVIGQVEERTETRVGLVKVVDGVVQFVQCIDVAHPEGTVSPVEGSPSR